MAVPRTEKKSQDTAAAAKRTGLALPVRTTLGKGLIAATPGVRTNPESQCQHHCGSKRGILPERARRVPTIKQERFDHRDRLHLSSLFPQQSGVAELASRGLRGDVGCHPLANEPLREQAEVFLHLGIEPSP